jgi:phenylalanyl-tRNA synthetase beta subunit
MAHRIIDTTVSVDVAELLEDIDTDDLIEELEARGVHVLADDTSILDLCREALAELSGGRPLEAQAILERALFPKFRNADEASRRYAQERLHLLKGQ